MKKLISILSLALMVVFASCGGGSGVDCSPEMKGFMGDIKGKAADVTAALAKYGKDSLDAKDMDLYDLSEATVTVCEKKDGKEMCTFEAKAGMTVRTYMLTWEGGKITAVEDKGMK